MPQPQGAELDAIRERREEIRQVVASAAVVQR